MAFFDNKWVLVGVTSSGHGCGHANSPGFYTRVSFFVPFIQNIMNYTAMTVRSTLRTTRLTSSTTTTLSTQTLKNGTKTRKDFFGESIFFFVLWFLLVINI